MKGAICAMTCAWLVLAAAAAMAEPAGYVPARKLADELKLTYMSLPIQGDKPPFAVGLTQESRKVMLYAGVSHATVDNELWPLTKPVLGAEKDLLVPDDFRVKLGQHYRVALQPIGGPTGDDKSADARRSGKRFLVVLDPGHGGHDPGATRGGVYEKDIVLDIARRTAQVLRAADIEAVMTRSTDVFVTLEDRVRIANRYTPDLFVSIHADAADSASASGSAVYYPDDKPGEDKADITYRAQLHARDSSLPPQVVGSPGRLSEAVEAAVYGEVLEEYRARSRRAGQEILRGLSQSASTENRGVHQANYRVVRYMQCPTVLVEVEFLTNPAARQRLQTTAFRQAIAQGVAGGVQSYLRSTAAEAPKRP